MTTRPKLPPFFRITFYGEDTILLPDIYWSLEEAKAEVRLDILSNWDDDIPYRPNQWNTIEPKRLWSYAAGDCSYDIVRIQPEAQS